MKNAVLHLHAQDGEGDCACIVGSKKALEALKKAITSVLENETCKHVDVQAADGVTYSVLIACLDELKTWGKVKLPYRPELTDEITEEKLLPWDLIIGTIPELPGDVAGIKHRSIATDGEGDFIIIPQ